MAGSSHSWRPQVGIALPTPDAGRTGCAVPQVPAGKAKLNEANDKINKITPAVVAMLSRMLKLSKIENTP